MKALPTRIFQLIALALFSILLWSPQPTMGGKQPWGEGEARAARQHLLPAERVLELLEGLGKGEIMLIDVREPQENLAVRIPNSLLMPLNTIGREAGKLNRKGTIILYCKTGIRAKKARRIMKKMGFEYIYILDGGIEAWMEIRGPLETPGSPDWIFGKGCES